MLLRCGKVLSYTSPYMHPTSDKNVFGGKWWRFDRYEVKDGRIRPIEGLPLRIYEPWGAYHAPQGKKPRKQPYHSLIELVRSIDTGELDPDERDLAIVDWCGKYGLLGVLFARTSPASEPADLVGDRYISLWGGTLDDPTGAKCAVIPNPLLAEIYLQPGSMTVRRLGQREYSEPVEDLLAAGYLLRKVVEQLQATRDSKKKLIEKQAEFSKKTKLMIESLVSSVRPTIHLETRSHFRLGWDCGSLWSNFVMMAVLDLTNSRPLICRNSKCGAFFVSKSTEAKYCSRQCRGAVQIRKYRAGLTRKAKGKKK
jgi:hypothetical protein